MLEKFEEYQEVNAKFEKHKKKLNDDFKKASSNIGRLITFNSRITWKSYNDFDIKSSDYSDEKEKIFLFLDCVRKAIVAPKGSIIYAPEGRLYEFVEFVNGEAIICQQILNPEPSISGIASFKPSDNQKVEVYSLQLMLNNKIGWVYTRLSSIIIL
jgi:hypothetical protein